VSETSILVIEDEPAIAETIEYALESEGFRTLLAGTAETGLELWQVECPDFVILDVGLPDRTGFEVCREIRKHSEVPILFLTARESEIDRVVGLEMGGDDYVVKPFSPRELTARVKAILRRTSAKESPRDLGEGDQLESGRITLSRERYEACLDGKNLELSRYEFGMLEVFLQTPERVFTRNQLMDRVWDEPETALDRTVDAHIKTLRKKLHSIDPGFDPIQTIRGVGYSYRPDLG